MDPLPGPAPDPGRGHSSEPDRQNHRLSDCARSAVVGWLSERLVQPSEQSRPSGKGLEGTQKNVQGQSGTAVPPPALPGLQTPQLSPNSLAAPPTSPPLLEPAVGSAELQALLVRLPTEGAPARMPPTGVKLL